MLTKVDIGPERQRLQAAQSKIWFRTRQDCAACKPWTASAMARMCCGRRAATAADNIQPAVGGEFAKDGRMFRKPFHRNRRTHSAIRHSDGSSCRPAQSRESSSTYGRICLPPSAQLIPTDSRLRVRDGIPERLDGLTRKRSAAVVRDRDGYHDWNAPSCVLKILLESEQRGFGVDACRIRSRPSACPRRHPSGRGSARNMLDKRVESRGAECRIVDVGRHGRRAIRRSDATGHKTRVRWIGCHRFIGRVACEPAPRPHSIRRRGIPSCSRTSRWHSN